MAADEREEERTSRFEKNEREETEFRGEHQAEPVAAYFALVVPCLCLSPYRRQHVDCSYVCSRSAQEQQPAEPSRQG